MTISDKTVVTVASGMMLLFLTVAWLETQFFLLHFFEALIYLIIILLFFYFEDRFGYALAVFVPALWILLQFFTGRLHAGLRELVRVASFRGVDNPVSLVAGLILLTGLLLIFLATHALRREVSGTPYLRSSLLVGACVAVGYYGIVVYWFSSMFQPMP